MQVFEALVGHHSKDGGPTERGFGPQHVIVFSLEFLESMVHVHVHETAGQVKRIEVDGLEEGLRLSVQQVRIGRGPEYLEVVIDGLVESSRATTCTGSGEIVGGCVVECGEFRARALRVVQGREEALVELRGGKYVEEDVLAVE